MSARQFNVPLDERHALVLHELALRDERTVPDLLRPVIQQFLDNELAGDPDLRHAVDAIERARRRRRATARVTRLRRGDDGTGA